MLTNMESQLRDQQALDKLPAVLEEELSSDAMSEKQMNEERVRKRLLEHQYMKARASLFDQAAE